MMVLDGLPQTKQGYFRLLETNKRIILPTNTHLRLLVSAADVLHS
jgi:heme/copper-type cytochrome/quinol oxidase subunit 2